MASVHTLHIDDASIPSQEGKVALITGGSSGIGLCATKILTKRGAKVFIFDLQPPIEDGILSDHVKFVHCDVTNWTQLRSCFLDIGHIDMVFANAGILEDKLWLDDSVDLDDDGLPQEPSPLVIDTNFRAVVNLIKLSWSVMKRQESGGSIVLNSSVAAYFPESAVAIYSALKMGLVSLVRSLRSYLPQYNITINAVAPSSTDTPIIPPYIKDILDNHGIPISDPHLVAMAMVYSAVAVESRRVEPWGKDSDANSERKARWNGRVILTQADQNIEVEEPIAGFVDSWFGTENLKVIRARQSAFDRREGNPTVLD